MNEFKMSLFLAPISPVKDGGTGQIIKPATLKPYKTMTLQEVYRTITANTRLQLLTDRMRTVIIIERRYLRKNFRKRPQPVFLPKQPMPEQPTPGQPTPKQQTPKQPTRRPAGAANPSPRCPASTTGRSGPHR